MVYAPLPAALVEWLREILPGKTTAELYMAIGCQKHAKTESYREYLVYLQGCNEQFIEAPGIRGMVMLVFTLPGFDRVFKVIKDKFAPQKEMSAAHVRACYQLVKEHDRVGRMADTQEFENFVLEKRHISPALMELLLQEAAEKITDLGEQIVIRHLYIERQAICSYAARAAEKLRSEHQYCRFISTFIKTSPFALNEPYYGNSASVKLLTPTQDSRDIINAATRSLDAIWQAGHRYQKAGVMLGDFFSQGVAQLNLFDDNAPRPGSEQLMTVMDTLNAKEGRGTLYFAGQGIQQQWQMKRAMLSPRYTTRSSDLLRVK